MIVVPLRNRERAGLLLLFDIMIPIIETAL